MTSNNHYDVIIIGTGAGGGTLAYKLAPSGKKILLLERGDYVPREKDNWSTRAVNLEGKYNTKEAWRDSEGTELHPHTNYYVGGNTKFYGAALFRLRKEDFGEIRHHGGISPSWPVSYEELEPYYTAAEHLYKVHGNRGEDPTEPWASAPYKYPAVSHEQRLQHLHDDFERAGLKPFHVPLGIRLDENNQRKSLCIRCNTCDGHPCLIGGKSDAQTICVDPALEYKNVELITNAKVMRLETNGNAREVSKVVVDRNGVHEEFSADIVVVSCGAVNSAALLLRSANDSHPNGLANGSDVVGRHYMGHINSVLMALSKCPNPTIFQKTLAINDFYLTSEDLPDANNRVTVDRDDQIRVSYKLNNVEGHDRLKAQLQKAMKQTNCDVHGHECHQGLFARNLYLGQRLPLAAVAHQNGTVRFGDDPKTSALDRNCKAHEIDNLYVVDASFFPSSGAVNPALTIMANALRVGDHLLERLK